MKEINSGKIIWDKRKAVRAAIISFFLLAAGAAAFVLSGVLMAIGASGWFVFWSAGFGTVAISAYGDRRAAMGYIDGSIAFITGKKDNLGSFSVTWSSPNVSKEE